MTTLDRSFIKAFGEAHVLSAGRPHRSVQATSARTAMAQSTAEGMTRPRPLVASERAPFSIRQSTNPLAPLSSFVAPPRVHDAFRALLEVDSLSWPSGCVELLQRATAAWDRFAQRLTERAIEDNKTVTIVSCRRGEGRTTIALATARHMAARGMRCVVVDADFDNPTLAACCGLSPQVGWGEVIEGDLPFGEALVSGIADNVTVMPWLGLGGRLAQSSAMLRATTGFRLLREHYDLVIVDALPIAASSSQSELTSLVSVIGGCGAYLVRDVRVTQPQQAAGACARLGRMSIKVAGMIENFQPPSPRTDE